MNDTGQHPHTREDRLRAACERVDALREVFADARARLAVNHPTIYQVAGELALALAECAIYGDDDSDNDALISEARDIAKWAAEKARYLFPDSWDYVGCLHRLAEVYRLIGENRAELFTRQQIIAMMSRNPDRFGPGVKLTESLEHVRALEDVHGPAFALAEIEHLLGEMDYLPPAPVILAIFADIVRLRLKFNLNEDAIVAAQAQLTLFHAGFTTGSPATTRRRLSGEGDLDADLYDDENDRLHGLDDADLDVSSRDDERELSESDDDTDRAIDEDRQSVIPRAHRPGATIVTTLDPGVRDRRSSRDSDDMDESDSDRHGLDALDQVSLDPDMIPVDSEVDRAVAQALTHELFVNADDAHTHNENDHLVDDSPWDTNGTTFSDSEAAITPEEAWDSCIAPSVGMIIDARPRQARRVLDLIDNMISTAEAFFGEASSQALSARLQRALFEITIATKIRREHVADLAHLRDDIVLHTLENDFKTGRSTEHPVLSTPDTQSRENSFDQRHPQDKKSGAHNDDAEAKQKELDELSARVNAHLGLTMFACLRGRQPVTQAVWVLEYALKNEDVLGPELAGRVRTALETLKARGGSNRS